MQTIGTESQLCSTADHRLLVILFMQSRSRTQVWMGAAFGAALALAAVVLAIFGAGEHGTKAALDATARLSFLLFWGAYSGGALTALFGTAFQPLKMRARELGLAFAAAHLVHIGLIVWLCWIGAAPTVPVFVFFGVALVLTYLLAFFSIGDFQRALGPRPWWILRTMGMNYIAFAFFVDFKRYPLQGLRIVEYLPFFILAVSGPMLRLAAWTERKLHRLP